MSTSIEDLTQGMVTRVILATSNHVTVEVIDIAYLDQLIEVLRSQGLRSITVALDDEYCYVTGTRHGI
jgi:polyhydroxyalkanoate synthesis regulator protein